VNELLGMVDVFLPNEVECRAIGRMSDMEQAAEKIARQVTTLAVKLGRQGAIALQGELRTSAPPLPVQVRDTVGAGDSFDAGFIYGFLQGWTLERMLRMGCVCGSLSTRLTGGTAGQPTLDEALAYL
jgi:sugar/nucleoside kinase (ribokinase family)